MPDCDKRESADSEPWASHRLHVLRADKKSSDNDAVPMQIVPDEDALPPPDVALSRAEMAGAHAAHAGGCGGNSGGNYRHIHPHPSDANAN